ncbi:MAG: hypothetical protein KGL10_09325 [Alphaproteobacteria bacterium]|nr:hypothetical protein [Alphaproteobacteria bacterium]MDE2337500.1 hypothetical protein [Alphaproteobacteria bacterium]
MQELSRDMPAPDAAELIVKLATAGLSGTLIPLALHKTGFGPPTRRRSSSPPSRAWQASSPSSASRLG